MRYIALFCLALLCHSCVLPEAAHHEAHHAFVHDWWLIILAGFSSSILFMIWKNMSGHHTLGWKKFWGIVWAQVGHEKHELGILALSLAILCWLVSGLVGLAFSGDTKVMLSSICSTVNSCFLLLFIRHLDKDDLPDWFWEFFPSRQTIGYITVLVVMSTLALRGLGEAESRLIVPDTVLSVFTLVFIGLAFYFLLSQRMGSKLVGVLAILPIVITFLAEMANLASNSPEISQKIAYLALWKQTLFFAYKPLLIISYFLLIHSWQQKRMRLTQLSGQSRNGITVHIADPSAPLTDAELAQNRSIYRLDERDWLILEGLVQGKSVPEIARANSTLFRNGTDSVEERLKAISRAFGLDTQAQLRLVLHALRCRLVQVAHINAPESRQS